MLEAIITYITTHFKLFLSGFITGGVLHYFEIQVGNTKFNIGTFLISCIIFGLLTEFSHLLIKGQFIGADLNNESRVIVLSIILAAVLYLFIPFVLKPENRQKFIEEALGKFGFYKKEK